MTPLAADDPRAAWAVVWFLGAVHDPAGRWSVSSFGVSYWGSEPEARAYAEKRTGHPRGDSIAVPLAIVAGDDADSIATRALAAIPAGATP